MTRTLLVLSILALAAVPATAALSLASPVPISDKHAMPLLTAPSVPERRGYAGNNLVYHNGPVQTTPKVYLVLWGWGGSDPSGESPRLQAFVNGVGGSGWANIQTQYSGITNPTGQLKGVWADDASVLQGGVPVVPDLYIANEAIRAANHFGYDANADYIIATPHLHNDAAFGAEYCAWHSDIIDSGRDIAYTDLPYIPDAQAGSCGQNFVNSGAAGNLDGVTIVGGHEYAEAVTDPHLDAWYDSSGAENGDKCAWNAAGPDHAGNLALSTGTFAVQSLWSNANSGCRITYP